MTARSTLAPKPPVKTEPEPSTAAPVEPRITTPVSRVRAYWGDRWTLVFWLCCFAIMAGMNLIEAVRNLILYLTGGSSSP
jgi:hypothetical protein